MLRRTREEEDDDLADRVDEDAATEEHVGRAHLLEVDEAERSNGALRAAHGEDLERTVR